MVESTDEFDTPMLDFETDYELKNYELIEFLPDQVRDKIVEKLRKTAIEIKLKVLKLVQKMDDEIVKLGDAYPKATSPFIKGKIWTQIRSLKLLKTVTVAGLDKFDQYIISENSRVLENLIRSIERLFECKFMKFTMIAKTSLKLLTAVKEATSESDVD